MTDEATQNQAEEFLRETSHVPDEVGDNKQDQFKDLQPEILGPEKAATGWTAEKIADIFSGVFSVLVFSNLVLPIGGDHWNIPRDQCLKLGEAWLPIFEEHVPYESNPSWMPKFLLYITVLGTTKEVVGPAWAAEMRQQKENQRKAAIRKMWEQQNPGKPFPGFTTAATTTANTATVTPQESTASSAPGEAAKPSSNGFQSNFRSID